MTSEEDNLGKQHCDLCIPNSPRSFHPGSHPRVFSTCFCLSVVIVTIEFTVPGRRKGDRIGGMIIRSASSHLRSCPDVPHRDVKGHHKTLTDSKGLPGGQSVKREAPDFSFWPQILRHPTHETHQAMQVRVFSMARDILKAAKSASNVISIQQVCVC